MSQNASGGEASEVVLGAETTAKIVSRLGILPLLRLRPLVQLGRVVCQVLRLLPLVGGQPLPTLQSSPLLKAAKLGS